MPKKLYERGPPMPTENGKRMFEGPTLEQIDQAKRGARTPEAIDKSRELIRKGPVVVPPRSNGVGRPSNGPPIKSKFE